MASPASVSEWGWAVRSCSMPDVRPVLLFAASSAALFVACARPPESIHVQWSQPPQAPLERLPFTTQEHAVYVAAITHFVEGMPPEPGPFVLMGATVALASPWRETFPGCTWGNSHPSVVEALDDYSRRNAVSYVIEEMPIHTPHVVMFDLERSRQGGPESSLRGMLYAQHPSARALLTLSRVGWDAGRDVAVVEVGYRTDSQAGAGVVFVLERERDKWRVVRDETAWMS